MDKWFISKMEVEKSENNLNNIVKVIYWQKIREQYGFISIVNGELNCPDPNPDNFIDYNNLTFDEVCNWLEQNLDLITIDLALTEDINNQINPKIIDIGLPFKQEIN